MPELYFLYRLLIIRPFCWRKRRKKIDEIRTQVGELNDPNGRKADLALGLFEDIRHTMDHYLISFPKIGVKDFKGKTIESLTDLYVVVGESIERYGSRNKQ